MTATNVFKFFQISEVSGIDPLKFCHFIMLVKCIILVKWHRFGKVSSFYRVGKVSSFYHVGKVSSFYRVGKGSSFYHVGKVSSFYHVGKVSSRYIKGLSSGSMVKVVKDRLLYLPHWSTHFCHVGKG